MEQLELTTFPAGCLSRVEGPITPDLTIYALNNASRELISASFIPSLQVCGMFTWQYGPSVLGRGKVVFCRIPELLFCVRGETTVFELVVHEDT